MVISPQSAAIFQFKKLALGFIQSVLKSPDSGPGLSLLVGHIISILAHLRCYLGQTPV